MRTAYDFSPRYRSIIGIDRVTNPIDTTTRNDVDSGLPLYDIKKLGDDGYRITLAVAGFIASELEVTAQPNLLIVVKPRKVRISAPGVEHLQDRHAA